MAWSFLQHKSVPDSAERARNILGSFELQLLDPSCRHCCRVLVFLPLCAGTWDRSPCPACRDGSHILQPRLVAELLLRSTLSVDVTSQIWRSYLELCESLDVSETFLERSASKLLLFLQQVWLLRSTSTQNCAFDIVHVVVLAMDSL